MEGGGIREGGGGRWGARMEGIGSSGKDEVQKERGYRTLRERGGCKGRERGVGRWGKLEEGKEE